MKTLLMIDNHQDTLDVMEAALSNKGFSVKTAASGAEGVALFKKEKFDIVVTDLVMPEMDGIGVLEKVRKLSKNTIVIIVTGFGEVTTSVEAMQKGADDYMLKPTTADRIKASIQAAYTRRGTIEKVDEPSGWKKSPQAGLVGKINTIESDIIRDALKETGWNQVRAAKKLGLKRSSLQYKIKKYGLQPPK